MIDSTSLHPSDRALLVLVSAGFTITELAERMGVSRWRVGRRFARLLRGNVHSCVACGAAIPTTRRADARFCGDRCRKRRSRLSHFSGEDSR
jgi:hypothetical protein